MDSNSKILEAINSAIAEKVHQSTQNTLGNMDLRSCVLQRNRKVESNRKAWGKLPKNKFQIM